MKVIFKIDTYNFIFYIFAILSIINVTLGNNTEILNVLNEDNCYLGHTISLQYRESDCAEATASLNAQNGDPITEVYIRCKNKKVGTATLPKDILHKEKNIDYFSLNWDVGYYTYRVNFKILGLKKGKLTSTSSIKPTTSSIKPTTSIIKPIPSKSPTSSIKPLPISIVNPTSSIPKESPTKTITTTTSSSPTKVKTKTDDKSGIVINQNDENKIINDNNTTTNNSNSNKTSNHVDNNNRNNDQKKNDNEGNISIRN
ncbi:hypothetical protein PIROE2DRAFT_10119 [Piromyces sp. E2]|nr:hypothetical protein PIROE2DRAFT_10119 [Piromyces sp. E2]|eukprot:OUM63336.1 hypothetical protein PIROE2DRAFT_10119 [Piromyces sp. E2]